MMPILIGCCACAGMAATIARKPAQPASIFCIVILPSFLSCRPRERRGPSKHRGAILVDRDINEARGLLDSGSRPACAGLGRNDSALSTPRARGIFHVLDLVERHVDQLAADLL